MSEKGLKKNWKYKCDWQSNFISNVEHVIKCLGISKRELSRDTGRNCTYWNDVISQNRAITLHQAVNISLVLDFLVDDLIKNPEVFEDTASKKIDKWQERMKASERQRIRIEIKKRAYEKEKRGCKGKQKTIQPSTV